MSTIQNGGKCREIPDISVELPAEHAFSLDRVGMKSIECPVQFEVNSKLSVIPAKVDAYVSLDKADAKGIHMSRLFLNVTEALENNVLNFVLLEKLLAQILDTHKGISKSAEIKVHFELPVKRKALLSSEHGWRQYPISFISRLNSDGTFTRRYKIEILYSSTCPCSAALSRDLVQQEFKKKFKDQEVNSEEVHSWLGTQQAVKGVAHAQRSRANVILQLNDQFKAPLEYIDAIEESLGTPVQAAVKRVDEQEFARINAENLMFCEDAGRKIKAFLENSSEIVDYHAEVAHEESLHPHDAVSAIVKGVAGGFQIQDL